MRLLIKRLSAAAVCAVIFLFSAVDCSAADLSGSMSVPSMVTKGKNFTVGLQAQCPEKLGTVMFTVVFSDNIQYKSCKVNDSNGYIKSYCTDNILRVVYINTLGINVSNINQLVNVTFKAAEMNLSEPIPSKFVLEDFISAIKSIEGFENRFN